MYRREMQLSRLHTGLTCRTHSLARVPLVKASRKHSVAVSALLDPAQSVDLLHHAQNLVDHLPLLYEPVAAPCSLMNCGDVVHRR